MVLNSCSNSHWYEKYYGIYIDHYWRQGSGFKDSTGAKQWYFYVKTVITNDSSVSAHVRLDFPKEYFHTEYSDSAKYRVFLISESMAIDNVWKDNVLVSGRLKKYFDSGMKPTYKLDTVLKPNEECTVYLGFIGLNNIGLNPSLSLFSRGYRPHFWPNPQEDERKSLLAIPDSALKRYFQPSEKSLSLYLGINTLNVKIKANVRNYNIIPCGEISYAD